MTSDMEHHRTSDIGHKTVEIRHQTSDIGHKTSDVQQSDKKLDQKYWRKNQTKKIGQEILQKMGKQIRQ